MWASDRWTSAAEHSALGELVAGHGILRFVEVGWILLSDECCLSLQVGATGRVLRTGLRFHGLWNVFDRGLLALFGVAHLCWLGAVSRESWARSLGLVIGFLALLRPPFGTALGIYNDLGVVPQQSGQEYERLSRLSVEAGLQPGR